MYTAAMQLKSLSHIHAMSQYAIARAQAQAHTPTNHLRPDKAANELTQSKKRSDENKLESRNLALDNQSPIFNIKSVSRYYEERNGLIMIKDEQTNKLLRNQPLTTPWPAPSGLKSLDTDKSDTVFGWEERRKLLEHAAVDNTMIKMALKRQVLVRKSFENFVDVNRPSRAKILKRRLANVPLQIIGDKSKTTLKPLPPQEHRMT